MSYEFPVQVKITQVSDGLGYETNDQNYIGPHLGKICFLTRAWEHEGFYVTDIPVPDHPENNDYVLNGFLIVSDGNFKKMPTPKRRPQ